MKSKIFIDVDHDNQPIIKIDYNPSEDVRDKLVKKFLETFGAEVCWAQFNYVEDRSMPFNHGEKSAIIRPICAYDLPEVSKTIAVEAERHLNMRNWSENVESN